MKDVSKEFEFKGKKYRLVFNLNVMEEIQEEYGTLDKWGALTDGKSQEVSAKAVKFGFTAMLNEGIDIDNENREEKVEPFTQKQVGRLLTEIGLEEMTNKLNSVVIESTKSVEKN